MLTAEGYRGKRVIVTGCSSGIGLATVQALLASGAQVDGLDVVDPTIPMTSFSRVDLADPESIVALARELHGDLHALFNCAGVTPMRPASQVLAVNFLGTRLLTRHLVELMPAGGAIVSTSSNGGFGWRRRLPELLEFVGIEDFDAAINWFEARDDLGPAYSFSKEAMNVWTMQESAILIGRGIRINTVSPGAVQTPMLDAIEHELSAAAIAPTLEPVGRRSTPEEQAAVLLFLNSDRALYVNGVDLPVDGGYWAMRSIAGALGR